MPTTIKDLMADADVVALTLRQPLVSVDGPDVPVFPPTYPPDQKRKTHRYDTPYTINEMKDGTRTCELDSVQSQANRMEEAFVGVLADVVPRHVVSAGNHQIDLVSLPHRITDASIRATKFAGEIKASLEAFEAGDPVPLASIAPTSLVYGAWDSRDTQVRLPRAVRSGIRASDVSVLTRSAQYSGSFSQEALALDDRAWKKAANVGFAPTPSVDQHGGVVVHGEVVQSASILLNLLRTYRGASDDAHLPAYLAGLALGGLLTTGREYNLRSGCVLVPAEPGTWTTISADGGRQEVAIDAEAVLQEVRELAMAWGQHAGVELGGAPHVHRYDPKRGSAAISSAKADTS